MIRVNIKDNTLICRQIVSFNSTKIHTGIVLALTKQLIAILFGFWRNFPIEIRPSITATGAGFANVNRLKRVNHQTAS